MAGMQRLRLEEYQVVETDNQTTQIKVKLSAKDQHYYGEHSGANDEQAQVTTAAQAAVNAIASALVPGVKLGLKGVNANQVFEGMDESLIVVVVEFNDGGDNQVMPGSCRNTGNSIDATIKATLDATNRIVEVHMA